jgi:glycosyltransferase involved in cell wall biosynthesis
MQIVQVKGASPSRPTTKRGNSLSGSLRIVYDLAGQEPAETRASSGQRRLVKCLIVVPAYNEEQSIARTVAEIRTACPQAGIVVVNDGSADATSGAARATGVPVLDLPFNLGIGGAVQAGYLYAVRHGYDVAVQVDGDGQHPVDQIERLLQPLRDNAADLVIGSRFLPDSAGFRSSPQRRLGIGVLRMVLRVLGGQTITDPTSGFRACNLAVLRLFAELYPRDYPEPEAVLLVQRRKFRLKEVAVTMRPRSAGRSSIHGWRDLDYMVRVILAMLVEALRRRPD